MNGTIKTLPLVGILISAIIFSSCTKVGSGFISPTMQYSVKVLSIVKGQISNSTPIVADGSDIPLNVRWVHIYDSTGKLVDDIFEKKYSVDVWSSAFDAKIDTTYASIMAKRTTSEINPIVIDPISGVIHSNAASLYIPVGKYTMDIEVTNSAGSQLIEKAMTLIFSDGSELQLEDVNAGTAFSFGRLMANTSAGAPDNGNSSYYTSVNNPYIIWSVTRFSDVGNEIIFKITDRNGVVFNPKAGEIRKRPATGINPQPPFLQNLQDYAPDTFVATDTSMNLKFPVTPFPINSLGNGFNMYYCIPTNVVTMDSTSSYASNEVGPNTKYTGSTDKHYLGTFKNGLYDFSIRIPMRVFVPGSYYINMRLLPVTHR